ncbi:uncharacterized protein LOC128246139 [Mya arenaria]|uniref:uncharacterized protein LOC128246139 n=1 Tax=Mya arenaria TaxID=6604 RepID=UPI0022E0B8DD|nr:uncharacterized protein LOC128246139 [Mya arenaria]
MHGMQLWLKRHWLAIWIIESPPHAKQADGLSCGVYVLMLAECFLNGQSLQFSMKKDELVGVRKTIAAHLLHNAVMIGPTVEDGIPAVEEAAQSQSQPIEEAAISAVEEAVDSKSQPPVDKATIPADQLASQPPVEKARKTKRKDKVGLNKDNINKTFV